MLPSRYPVSSDTYFGVGKEDALYLKKDLGEDALQYGASSPRSFSWL